MELECLLCGSDTDLRCSECGEPVCEDCCVVTSPPHFPIEDTICLSCWDRYQVAKNKSLRLRHEAEVKAEARKEKKRNYQREYYNRPENVERRRVKKLERQQIRASLMKKQLEESFAAVRKMMR